MGLNNQQIERYARQIIVPGVGGIAQERLLSARLMLTGKAADVASLLAYMVGAGVGDIRLQLAARDTAEQDSLMINARRLNPEVVVRPAEENIAGLNLIVAIAGESEPSELVLSTRLLCADTPLIIVRLDEPPVIAILPKRPPCPWCADADLIAPSRPRCDNAGFVAMVAATEAFKLLACLAPNASPALLQFSGFACVTRQLRQRPLGGKCACSA